MKNILFFTLMVLTLTTSGWAKAANKRVLMMVSEGFYAPEYFIPLKAFESQGFQVTTATKQVGPIRPDMRQIDQYPGVKGDITFDQIKVEDYDAIVFAGGNGAWEDFFPNERVHKALSDFMKEEKLVALLCSSTGLLGLANNLNGNGKPVAEGRKVTGYKRVEGLLTKLGKVNYQAGPQGGAFVVVDGNLITGRDPESSEKFAAAIVQALLK